MSYITLTDSNFQEEVINSKVPVLVDFWASWCHPCQMLGPVIEQLAGEYQGKAKVAKLNVDENNQTAEMYGIMSLPTVFFFKNGQPVKSLVGVQPKESYKSEIDQLLA